MANTKVIAILVKTFAKMHGNIEPLVGGNADRVLGAFLGATLVDKVWNTAEELKESLLYKVGTSRFCEYVGLFASHRVIPAQNQYTIEA